jgi:hypothetical protein
MFFRLLPRGFGPVGELLVALAGGFADGPPRPVEMAGLSRGQTQLFAFLRA